MHVSGPFQGAPAKEIATTDHLLQYSGASITAYETFAVNARVPR
jgi:hypothetical protein